jgi:uncharacterized protein YndB with AHSA1/START domain
VSAPPLTLHLERVLDVPRALVFDACTTPELLAAWWGPRGFTSPRMEIDLRVGGSYRLAMQPPEGELFHLAGEFREVDPPGRLAYTFRWEEPDPDDQETVVTISLRDLGESLELIPTRACSSPKPGWTCTLAAGRRASTGYGSGCRPLRAERAPHLRIPASTWSSDASSAISSGANFAAGVVASAS